MIHRGPPCSRDLVVVHTLLIENVLGLGETHEELTVTLLVEKPTVVVLWVTLLPRALFLNVERAAPHPSQWCRDLFGTELGPIVAAHFIRTPSTANGHCSVLITCRAANVRAPSIVRYSLVN